MKFKKLILENIGAYRGTNSFDLETSPGQNVVLIGGENGAGKTTFLNSIKLGLFGAFGFGFKNSSEYDKRVYASINSTIRTINNSSASIQIIFTEIENYQKNEYKIIRGWKLLNDKPKEYFMVYKNEQFLNEAETDNYFSKLKELFPPKLFDLCLFDGEEISKIINNNELSQYLKELSTIVFNLDLFNNLHSDLTNYLQKEIDEKKFNQTEEELFEEQKNKASIVEKVQNIELEINQYNEKKTQLNELFSSNKKSFEIHGGLKDEERNELLRKESEIESERKKLNEKVKGFISVFLPFYMNKKLLNESLSQINSEDQLILFKQASKFLSVTDIQDIVEQLDNKTIQPSELQSLILDKFRPKQEVNTIHNLSPSQRGQVEQISNFINNENHIKYLETISKNRELLSDAQEIRKKIATNDKANDFNKMLEEMERITKEISKIEFELQTLEEMRLNLNNKLTESEKVILAKETYLKQETRTENTFEMAQNIIKLSQRFQEVQHQKKLQQVQIAATDMLNKLMRKNQYISSIRINSVTFDVKLYNATNEEIEKITLSAGEKEILLLSIIWAMFKCSGRRVPFIFDTLLGRLDNTHKQRVLTDFIPKCGEQVLILSTNSEVNSTQFKLLDEHISKQYLLQFNTEEQNIKVTSGYFQFN
ncbi:DNA sulfur modification protein DndD [Gottfriedia luciferensis]|uniref:Nuclease SbcCD subunit C n=1 Tax=Gottfriedia luciferensis TaxID=178774 RepID=A0ABX2ZP44_9BACI|nr:DNA sulfur modification protein DndD [Gottfriedia luciferensis]ODG91505.1 DNA sulfur modification protein DndD [Gottfriedia luciferensis]